MGDANLLVMGGPVLLARYQVGNDIEAFAESFFNAVFVILDFYHFRSFSCYRKLKINCPFV